MMTQHLLHQNPEHLQLCLTDWPCKEKISKDTLINSLQKALRCSLCLLGRRCERGRRPNRLFDPRRNKRHLTKKASMQPGGFVLPRTTRAHKTISIIPPQYLFPGTYSRSHTATDTPPHACQFAFCHSLWSHELLSIQTCSDYLAGGLGAGISYMGPTSLSWSSKCPAHCPQLLPLPTTSTTTALLVWNLVKQRHTHDGYNLCKKKKNVELGKACQGFQFWHIANIHPCQRLSNQLPLCCGERRERLPIAAL